MIFNIEQNIKSESNSASILVIVEGASAGETVTLTLGGVEIASGVLTENLTCLFSDIKVEGIYTANYKTYNNNVEITASDILYSLTKSVNVLQSVTVTLTLEGAKEDTITITNASGEQLGICIFPSGSTVGTVDVQIMSSGENLTFESSVAKDTTSGTSNYTKTVPITRSTTNVKVMPEGLVLYWYGNKCEDVTGGYEYDKTAKRVVYAQTATPNILELDNTNDMVLGITSASGGGGIRTKNEINIDGYSTINVIWGEKSYFIPSGSSTKLYGANANSVGFGTGTNGVQDPVNVDWYSAYSSGEIQPSSNPVINIITHQLSTQLKQCYASFMLYIAQTAVTTYVTNPLALWLE